LVFQTNPSDISPDSAQIRKDDLPYEGDNTFRYDRGNAVRGDTSEAYREGAVDVGEEHLLTIRAAGDGRTIAQRAHDVTERLVPILSESQMTAADIRAVPTRGNRVKIMVMNHL